MRLLWKRLGRLPCGKALPYRSQSISYRGYASAAKRREPSLHPSGAGASYSRFTIHYLLLQSIGFDRSAFAAGRHKVAGQSKTKESSECSIHGEGLLERPIKN